MIEHTHNKPFYAVVVGRKVVFMARPKLTRQKKYREPIIAEKKSFKNKTQALIAAQQWEGQLV